MLMAVAARGDAPRQICCNNGAEITGRVVDLWIYTNRVTMEFSRPVNPTDNAYNESFIGRLRDECLNTLWFDGLIDARKMCAGKMNIMKVGLTGLSTTWCPGSSGRNGTNGSQKIAHRLGQ